ncbi:MAG: Ig-like domain-containing protein, partial [Desulfobacteraceae bacterium]|nr:Ig-like domain-containing protein [Desulfobacteraceae bacterium]
YTPATGYSGSDSFTFSVNDGTVSSSTATVSITVTGSTANHAPIITSTPVTRATVWKTYTYQVKAYDPDYDTLTYSLVNAPSGMTISSKGLITWTPKYYRSDSHSYSNYNSGSYQSNRVPVIVKVTDPSGLFATQSFTIWIFSDSHDDGHNRSFSYSTLLALNPVMGKYTAAGFAAAAGSICAVESERVGPMILRKVAACI